MILALTMASALLANPSWQAERLSPNAVVAAALTTQPPVVRVGSKSASLLARQTIEMKRRLRDDGRDDSQTAVVSKTAQSLFVAPSKVKVTNTECAKTLCQVQLTASAAATKKLVEAIDDPKAMSQAAAAGYRVVALASPATPESKGPQQVTMWLNQPVRSDQFEPVS